MYRILIADDEETIRNGIGRSLPWAEWGYEVCALCASGQEVVDRLDECRPDVVLSDIRMPGMDGVELMQYLNKNYPRIKIVILSGYSDFEYLNMSIKNRVAEYLLKPTDIDEFEAVFRRLKTTMDEERARDAEVQESVGHHFEYWLVSLMHGTSTPHNDERFLPRLAEQGIDLENLVVVVYTADDRAGDDRRSLSRLYRSILASAAARPPQGTGLRRLLFWDEDEAVVGLYTNAEREIAPGDLIAEVEAVQRAVRENTDATVSAGISDPCTEPSMLPQAYEQANCCARQNVFAGWQSICQFSSLRDERPDNLAYFDTARIEKALLAQDYDALREELRRVLDTFDGPMREYRYCDRMCLALLFHVALWGLGYGISMEDVLRSMGTSYTDIYLCDSLDKKRSFLLALLYRVQQELARRQVQGSATNSVAKRVRDYVDAEYCSNALSLESVAAHVHKSPAYISRVFKNELGCNFSDYLTEKRMRHALELLRDPDCRVYEAAGRCGYADASNFIRVFKRTYGISPDKYRTMQGGEG